MYILGGNKLLVINYLHCQLILSNNFIYVVKLNLILLQILEKILAYTPLKEVRFVSHFWNDVALSQDRLMLRIRTKYGQFGAFCSNMNPNLGRSITLQTIRRGNYFLCPIDLENLSHLQNTCGEQLREINYMAVTAQTLIDLGKLLDDPTNFQNLKYLHLTITDSVAKGFGSKGILDFQIRPRPRLTSMKLETMGEVNTYQGNLLNSAVNLERLELQGNWLPNLAMKRNLVCSTEICGICEF